MIVILARGYYCPKDQWQHKRLVEFYPELKVGYTKIVTISTDNLLETLEFRESLNAQWPFLSDQQRKIQKDFDISEGLGFNPISHASCKNDEKSFARFPV